MKAFSALALTLPSFLPLFIFFLTQIGLLKILNCSLEQNVCEVVNLHVAPTGNLSMMLLPKDS